jgi:ABC-type multidrug transport system fused ATPase/permease subunit
MRFYDADFGEVLIDGKNIKEYNIAELRKRIGLVMQEPTLFNYSISENLLYGKKDASNTSIQEAATVANATEFIESTDLSSAIEDTHVALYAEFTKKENEEILMKALGENYPLFLEDLTKL